MYPQAGAQDRSGIPVHQGQLDYISMDIAGGARNSLFIHIRPITAVQIGNQNFVVVSFLQNSVLLTDQISLSGS